MKDLPSKKHYCFNIHTLVMKNSTYLPPRHIDYPTFVMTLEFHMSIKHVFQESHKSPRLLSKNLSRFYGSQKAIFQLLLRTSPEPV